MSWSGNFLTITQANVVAWGLDTGEVNAAVLAANDFQSALQAREAARAAAKAATQTKQESLKMLESKIRSLAAQIRANGSISDSEIALAGISRRATNQKKSPTPHSHPVAGIDTSQRLRHRLRIRDANSPKSRARPAGTMGCEIWRKLGPTPPLDFRETTFLGISTKSSFDVEFRGDEAGQMAHYILRWLNTRGLPGPWSETASATVVG